MKIRIKFSKNGLMQYIGHLDMVRAWQKIFRSSGIPMAYTEGFNPHQIFSVAAPLAVGITSDGEYLDLKLKVENYDLKELVTQINHSCPEGLVILDAVELIGKETAGMAACKAADYILTLSHDLALELLNEGKIKEFKDQDAIIVKKKNKKGRINDLDLKPGILEFKVKGNELVLRLATGSTFNIKPELLMKALLDFMGVELNTFSHSRYYNIHRLDIYTSIDPLLTLTEGVASE